MTRPDLARDLPTGNVTLVFTDIEGSTKLLHELGAAMYAKSLAEHRRLLRDVFGGHGGVEVDTQGDAFFYAFVDPGAAVMAAEQGREALRSGRIRVRMGMHTGTPHLTDEGYVGEDVHKGARIGAAGHGGQVLLSDETRRAARLEKGAVVVDLGEHRLKDFAQPTRIFQLGTERFPPLKTISNTNLPRPASSFVGRTREVKELVDLVRGGARFVTLTGPGGSGKTRLSIEVASELLQDHKAGVFWVELAPLRDPALVTSEIASTLRAAGSLAEHIGEREMLLVLDNLEQVIDAAPQLAELMEACPNLRMLVTSRERLRVRGEVDYSVASLADPDAVALFVSRAGMTEPDDNVRALCQALDDMPLAIELAAARTRALTPAQILDRLSQRLDLLKGGRDADPRQRTLRSTIEWSHALLDAAEQRALARLSVFVGGCTLEAAEDVAGADLDTLQSLVEKSLLKYADGRFSMYETIREYARERLEEAGEVDALRRRHADWYLEFAETAEPHVIRETLRRPGEWTARVGTELDDIRSALDWFDAVGDGGRALRMAGALGWFWEERGPLAEGRRRLAKALATENAPTAIRAKALGRFAAAAALMGDLSEARAAGQRALALHRELGDDWRIAEDTHTLGYIAAEAGEWEVARGHFEEDIRLFRETGDEDSALWSTRSLGWTYHDTGNLERAREIHEANLQRAREVGNQAVEATTLGVLGGILIDGGHAEESLPFLERAYRLHTELDAPSEVAIDVWRFAKALAAIGRPEHAVELASLSSSLREEQGVSAPWVEREAANTLSSARAQIDAATFDAAWDRGKRLTPDAALALALARTSG